VLPVPAAVTRLTLAVQLLRHAGGQTPAGATVAVCQSACLVSRRRRCHRAGGGEVVRRCSRGDAGMDLPRHRRMADPTGVRCRAGASSSRCIRRRILWRSARTCCG
jgi:hypothetical protein